jgi:hypothetical protein
LGASSVANCGTGCCSSNAIPINLKWNITETSRTNGCPNLSGQVTSGTLSLTNSGDGDYASVQVIYGAGNTAQGFAHISCPQSEDYARVVWTGNGIVMEGVELATTDGCTICGIGMVNTESGYCDHLGVNTYILQVTLCPQVICDGVVLPNCD